MASSVEQQTMKKVAVRLVPFLCLLYTTAFIDRANVGFAALTMGPDPGLSSAAFGLSLRRAAPAATLVAART
jgi:ACS family tartrate transporter-like MFS transporter